MNYVVGFAFDRVGEMVALILKHQPQWQRGKFNGIGGKIQDKEEPVDAMIREFQEEAGVDTQKSHWDLFCFMEVGEHQIYCFRMFSHLTNQVKTMELEEISIHHACSLPANVIDNLNWLIPMALKERRCCRAIFPSET